VSEANRRNCEQKEKLSLKTIIKNGTVITAGDTFQADVMVENGKIVQLGIDIDPAGTATVIDATDKLIMPGGIDVHTHLAMPFGGTMSSDDFFTGHQAAAFGATTTHIDFVIQPIGGSLQNGIDDWHAKSKDKAAIDYGFHMAITDLRDEVMAEIPGLVAQGITSIKLFMAYKNVLQVDDTTLFRAMSKAAENGILTMVHAENGDVIDDLVTKALANGQTDPIYHAKTRPSAVEGEATGRAIALAGVANAPLFVVHMTCIEALEQLALGREKGYPVMGETCVQYMHIFEDDLAKPGFEGAKFVCSPPVRQPKDAAAIWKALQSGAIQSVSTDHCPFWFEGGIDGRSKGKELGLGDFSKIPNGMPGIEDRMGVMWHHGVNSGKLSPNRFVELLATNPAKMFGLYPHKGTISIGADADIVIWDPKKEHTISAATHHMATDYNVYEGMTCVGWADKVLLRGNLVVDGDQWLGEAGSGRFLHRQSHAEVL
jgi:dihydropyrimidinase